MEITASHYYAHLAGEKVLCSRRRKENSKHFRLQQNRLFEKLSKKFKIISRPQPSPPTLDSSQIHTHDDKPFVVRSTGKRFM
jgi:hypothetical protein